MYSEKCGEAVKKNNYGIVAAIIGHLLVILALVFYLAVPIIDWLGLWLMIGIGLALIVIALFLMIGMRKECELSPKM